MLSLWYRALIVLTFLFAFAKLPSILNFISPGAVENAGTVDLSRFLRQLFLGVLLVASGIGLVKRDFLLARGVGTLLCGLWLLDLALAAVLFGQVRIDSALFPMAYLVSVHLLFRGELSRKRAAA